MFDVKVRIKGFLDAIIAASASDNSLLKPIIPLIRKLTSDGVYFPSKFLFDQEKSTFEFTSLEATKNMCYDMNSEKSLTKIALFIANFLMIRILIPHIMIQPWECGIGAKPRSKVVLTNLKVISSLLYIIVRRAYPGFAAGYILDSTTSNVLGPLSQNAIDDSSNQKSTQIDAQDVFLPEQRISSLILKEEYFQHVKLYLESWIIEQKMRMEGWISQVIMQVYPDVHPGESLEMNKETKQPIDHEMKEATAQESPQESDKSLKLQSNYKLNRSLTKKQLTDESFQPKLSPNNMKTATQSFS